MPDFAPQDLLEVVAPADLPILRPDRYDGGGLSARLADFPPADAARLRDIYTAIQRIYALVLHYGESPPALNAEVRSLRARPEAAQIMTASRALGGDQPLAAPLRVILHDIRGGSLLALLMSIELLEPDRATQEEIRQIVFYSRDHLKMMRNAIPEIDPVQAERDRGEKPHAISLLREKWTNARFAVNGAVNQVTLDCSFEGDIASRCLEFSALDRVIYNLMNNAARFAVGQAISFSIFVPGAGRSRNIRFVIQNEITAEQARRIAELTEGDPGRLLLGGLTTGGNGLGLSICGEFVCHAFGLPSIADAIKAGYEGAKILGSSFVVWFHWPRAD